MAQPTAEQMLDWLEARTRKSQTGISFDWVPSVEGEPSGFRFMRRHHIGDPHKSLRQAITSEMAGSPVVERERAEGQDTEARGWARLESTYTGPDPHNAISLQDADRRSAAKSKYISRLRGSLAAIVADPDCCLASKAIARDGLTYHANSADVEDTSAGADGGAS